RDPLSDLDILEQELATYAADLDIAGGAVPLMERPRVVVLNKIDVPEARELAEMVRPDLESRGLRVFEISTASHEGLRQLSFALADIVRRARAEAPAPQPQRVVLRPAAVDDAGFTVTRRNGPERPYYQVRGEKPERWVRQTDFSNDEAVGYLADRLARLGVEDQLFKAGAVAGDEVVIGPAEGGVVFDWEPTMHTGAELLGSRGTDTRLEEGHRPTRAEKRRGYHDLMDAKATARDELWTERESGRWTSPEDEER
ncbi:Obg family GTPase CgtA, partial [Georgenia sp. 10Sc9-8]|nr:Obg family GTPase CgtA [Georgenia halotolerans]